MSTQFIQPPFLKSGDTVAIVAPGRKVTPADIDTAIKKFESWGLRVVLGKNLFSTAHSYLSGTDEQRLEDLQVALDDPTINAIVSARGGYGSTRLIDQLDFTSFIKKPKWLVGFSDITALHLKLLSLGFQSVHAVMPILFAKPNVLDSIISLKSFLFGDDHAIHAAGSAHNRHGFAEGPLVGGNLSLILESIGTSSEIDTNGKILILEEIDEYLYKIDRMMNQLKRAGKFKSLTGLIIGHMTDLVDTELRFGETMYDIILLHTRDYTFPIAFDFPTGHDYPNLAWPSGGQAHLTVTTEGSNLSF